MKTNTVVCWKALADLAIQLVMDYHRTAKGSKRLLREFIAGVEALRSVKS